ncbi:bacteriohemerythrin [mine drainage metagenome]|uniref:Bacteriohemerythrin n=1 Tax=mine drainage metagenome TaxID=410659 RepID=A0A1J5SE78_9ZZZZ
MKFFDVPQIELQHEVLVSMCNKLNADVKTRKSRIAIYQQIDDVIAFTRLHFSTEELLMAQSGYPEIETHKDKHQELIHEALHLKDKLNQIGEDMFTDWFNHWPFARVLAHIQFADKQIEEHIVQKQLKL